MAKQKEKEPEFDSDEERYTWWYLKELEDYNWIHNLVYHPEPFTLFEAVYLKNFERVKKRAGIIPTVTDFTFLREKKYTPDFKWEWDPAAVGVFCKRYDDNYINRDCFFFCKEIDGKLVTYIDVKGAAPATTHQGMSAAIVFPIVQKWLYQIYDIYVQKAIPVVRVKDKSRVKYSGLFVDTFVPKRYKLTDQNKTERKIEFPIVSMQQYINQMQKRKEGPPIRVKKKPK